MSRLLNIEIANTSNQTIANGGLVNLGNVVRKYCCNNGNNVSTFSYTNGSTSISLNQVGYYLIKVNATLSGNVAGTSVLTLFSNGVDIPQATASETITTADTEYRSISFTTTVRVLPNAPITITLVNEGVSVDINPVDIDIIKIC